MRGDGGTLVLTVVRFKAGLSDADVREKFAARGHEYERVPGLVEKLYVRYRDTGHFGAVYVWRDENALAAFERSDLGRTIAETYEVEGELESALADVIMVVRGASILFGDDLVFEPLEPAGEMDS
jgi:heme-degrading monooxygenase HmoA